MCTRCLVLVCWNGQRNLQKECIELVKQLWDNNVNAEVHYDSLQVFYDAQLYVYIYMLLQNDMCICFEYLLHACEHVPIRWIHWKTYRSCVLKI